MKNLQLGPPEVQYRTVYNRNYLAYSYSGGATSIEFWFYAKVIMIHLDVIVTKTSHSYCVVAVSNFQGRRTTTDSDIVEAILTLENY